MHAQVAELVDAHGSGPCAARCGGSSPLLGTIATQRTLVSQQIYEGFLYLIVLFFERRGSSVGSYIGVLTYTDVTMIMHDKYTRLDCIHTALRSCRQEGIPYPKMTCARHQAYTL